MLAPHHGRAATSTNTCCASGDASIAHRLERKPQVEGGVATRKRGDDAAMKRRTFLSLAGAGAAGAVLLRSRGARAFGSFPAGSESVQLGDGVRAKRVLEVFLY